METVENLAHKVADVAGSITRAIGFEIDHTAGTIFITGGTGVIGYRVANRLLAAGYPLVRLGVRNADTVSDLNKQGAEVADFCWEKEYTYEKALAGAHTVLCTVPHHDGWDTHFQAFLEACKKAGVRHFIKVSFYHSSHAADAEHVAASFRTLIQKIPLVQRHVMCDEMLAQSGLSFTILSPSHLMSNPLVYQSRELRKEGEEVKFYGASGGHGVNYVSPNDVAEVACRAILAPADHRHKNIPLTGPDAISDTTVATLLSKYLGKKVTFVDQSLEQFEEEEKKGGDPTWLVADLVGLERIKASGNEECVGFVTNDIQKMCGHAPETFEDYLLAKDSMTNKEKA